MDVTRECPALGAQLPNAMTIYFPDAQLPLYLRPLSGEEKATLERLQIPTVNALNHFRLFRIFASNYQDLIQTITSSLVPKELKDDGRFEFDRALLNFLASGRAITDHFDNYFTEKYRRTQHQVEFKNYLKRLREGSWEFAFMEDVRNYIQHQGLPLVDYSRNYSGTSVSLKLTINAKQLCQERTTSENARVWKFSKLNEGRGTLDFFEIIRQYYMRMSKDLLAFLAKWLAPEYEEAHIFFDRLTAEVRKAAPTAIMGILTSYDSVGEKHTFSMSFPPEDVFREMGMTIKT